MLKVIEQATHDGTSIDHVISIKDVFNALIDRKVVVYLSSGATINGVLRKHNGRLLHLVSEFFDTYIETDQVVGIAEPNGHLDFADDHI